jgi:hypothetical protein
MAETPEPRALSAALASPQFVTRGGGLAMHVANRHVERWAPEAGASRVRPLKNLGFVDRLVAPWIEAAQRSASLRMFSQYISSGVGERPASAPVSWVFPRPWYQDELDWMAAARTTTTQAVAQQAPSMFTTRGTYMAPAATRAAEAVLPAALYEYVAPSLSLARDAVRPAGTAFGAEAYSPLVPHAATQAATVMARVMAPLAPTRALSPGLRAVLTTMLERSARATTEVAPTRTSLIAPELVTPPAPRAAEPATHQALAVADEYAEQSARIAELQRAARIVTEREAVAREVIARPAPIAAPERPLVTTRSEAAASTNDAVAAERARIEERIAQRLAERQGEAAARQADAARSETVQRQAEAARSEIAQRQSEAARSATAQRHAETVQRHQVEAARRAEIAQRRDEANRLHESSREAAARDARIAPPSATGAAPAAPTEAPRQIPTEIAAALSALPPELASVVAAGIGARPERAAQAITELSEALRTVELMARTTAAGGTFESSRGPRLMMPAGLGGLVATIERTAAEPAAQRGSRGMSMAAARALAASADAPVRASTPARVPALPFLTASRTAAPAPTSALGATAAAEPAALTHVAWADRWLARFAGAKTQSLEVLTAASAGSPETRMAALAAAAPGAVFVSPAFADEPVAARASEAPAPFSPTAAAQGALAARPLGAPPVVAPAEAERVIRYADDAETPDDVFAAISQAATRSRVAPPPATKAEAIAAEVAAAEAARTFERETLADVISHAVPSAPGAGLAAQLASSPFAPALRHVLPLAAAPTFDIRALFGGGLGSTYLAGLLAPATREIEIASAATPAWASWEPATLATTLSEREAPSFEPEYVAPAASDDAIADESTSPAAAQQMIAPLTTLRSALLSWTVDAVDGGAVVAAPTVTATRETTLAAQPAARTLIDAMTLPTLGETAALRELGAIDLADGTTAHATSYASPGALADRAQSWSVAQERSVADLSFDFVPPELVLAARVYGLGPAEAAQALRLAIAGHGQLSAMAGAVDRTFVQALAIEHERRSGQLSIEHERRTGQPVSAFPLPLAKESSQAAGERPQAAAPGAFAPPAALAETAFGVERRMPRGAFLWPQGTIAALGLNAAAPDGDHAMSVAALELLAAQAVAELGTYAALSPERRAVGTTEAAAGTTHTAPTASAEPNEQEVLATATTLVSSARRAKFEAMYLALGQSPAARAWSPAARAARAVALAGRGDETITARERAEIAWNVLPVVSVGELGPDGEPATLSTGQAAERSQQRSALDLTTFVERPGLSTLSHRAGEALGSYVSPSAAPAAASTSSTSRGSLASRGEPGALVRPPTAAPELVQTGAASQRSWQRHGGGDSELPAWFEEAAKKMLAAERGGGVADNISLSELTLITSAPSTQIAASTRSAPSAQPTSAATKGADNKAAELDVEKIANDVYRQILVIMDATRARNGEPFL